MKILTPDKEVRRQGGQLEHVVSWFSIGPRRANGLEEVGKLQQGCCVAVCTFRRTVSLGRFLDSLRDQSRVPDELIIVDASPDGDTETALRQRPDLSLMADSVLYFRVTGPLKGLTRQRNFALRWLQLDLVAFFDDDIVLRPTCLEEMEAVHRLLGDHVVGVGAAMDNGITSPDWLWRTRRALGLVGSLRPGSYQRSGMSIPWGFLPPSDLTVEGDYLPGGATMWKTAVPRGLGFLDHFEGYAQGEDLDFSLRARAKGKLVIAGKARLLHLHEPSGRPNHSKLGYMAIYNRFLIHRRGLVDRTYRDVAWFAYAWTVDTILYLRHMIIPGRFMATFRHIGGRLRAAGEILIGRGGYSGMESSRAVNEGKQ